MRTLIRNAFIVPVDEKIGDIDGGDILIEAGIIKDIGKDLNVIGDADVIDGSGCIAIPGFVDTHRHLWEGALRSVTADWALLEFGGNMRMLASTCFRPEDMYAAAFQGGLECLNAGVTTVADYCHNIITPDHAMQNVNGLRDSGVRAVWSYCFTSPPVDNPLLSTGTMRADLLKKIAADHFGGPDDLVRVGICPEDLILVGPDKERLTLPFDLAREIGAPILLHANGHTKPDGGYPCEVEVLDTFGLLGPDLTLVHMGYTKPSEWQRLGEVGASVSFTPETELQMGMNAPPLTAAAEAGVNVSIGVDITANNSGDMFTQIRLALQVERAKLAEKYAGALYCGTGIQCADALKWGTIGGARALNMADRIGSLTPGKEADIVLIRGDDVSMVGWDRSNAAATVIQQAGTHVVDTVLVRGKVVKRDGRLVGAVTRACQLLEETSQYIHNQVRQNGGFAHTADALWARLSKNSKILEHAGQG